MSFKFFHYNEVGSTNIEARKLLENGVKVPFWLIADCQKQGKGRGGNIWVSEPGNFYSSYAFKAQAPKNLQPQLTFVAAIAVFNLIKELLDDEKLQLKIKWPNDVLINGAKISGILLESMITKIGESYIIIGIGINNKHKPDNISNKAICLNDLGIEIEIRDMLEILNKQLTKWLKKWHNGQSFSKIRDYLLENIYGLGSEIAIKLPNSEVRGEFIDIDDQGAMIIINKEGTRQVITTGDVRIL